MFDFDNTCIVNDVGEAALAYVCGHEILKDRTLLGGEDDSAAYHERVFRTYHALLEEGKKKAAYILNARMFSGFTPGEAEAAALGAVTEEGKKLGSKMLFGVHIERGLAVRREVMALMDFLRARGVGMWIVSASPEPVVRAVAKHFGIDAEVIGVRSTLEKGIFTSKLEEPIPMFEGKAECIRKFVGENPILAVGDSKIDLEMVEMADIKVAVAGRELAELIRSPSFAKASEGERGWFVLE